MNLAYLWTLVKMSNEKIIRELTKEYLSNTFKDCSIHEEFGVFLEARNDVMGVTWEDIISVEIKSNKDTFVRLENQLNTYNSFSTFVYVALDKLHLKKYEENYLNQFENVGILIYENDKLKLHYKPTRREFTPMYGLLTSQEMLFFFDRFKNKSLIPKDRDTTNTLIEDIFTENEIFNISKHIFLSRFLPNVSRTPPDECFINLEISNKKFADWLDESNWNMYTRKPFSWLKNDKIPKAKRSSLKCVRQVNKE